MHAKMRELLRELVDLSKAHGTGTAVGDPIEAHALAEALCGNRLILIGSINGILAIWTVGVAGLLKAMLVLKHADSTQSPFFETESAY